MISINEKPGGYTMKISTRGRYAIRLMTDIAINGENNNVSIKDISDRQGISVKYLEQIVHKLIKAGYLQSYRGSAGGYRLAKAPEEYTVADILRITEGGGLAPVACLTGSVNSCERKNSCSALWVWEGLYNTITDYLENITIKDIIDGNKQ